MANEYVKISEIKPGSKIVADGGFDCLNDGEICTVEKDANGLYVKCCSSEIGEPGKAGKEYRDQNHYLDGQIEDEEGHVIGFLAQTETKK